MYFRKTGKEERRGPCERQYRVSIFLIPHLLLSILIRDVHLFHSIYAQTRLPSREPVPRTFLFSFNQKSDYRSNLIISRVRSFDNAQVMQSQMIGLQSSLDRILSAIQGQVPPTAGRYGPTTARDIQSVYMPANGPPRGSVDIFNPSDVDEQPQRPQQKSFPPLPGFAPPV